jgi:prepilin-type N-terminal cleavage/methylation domain-containing protein
MYRNNNNPPVAAFTPPRQKGSVMRKRTSQRAGFTLVEIMIVVAIIGMLAAIAIPNFVKARTSAQKSACINNLRQLDGAIQEFALENKKATSDPVTLEDCTPYLKNSVVCPAGGTTINDSYSVTDCQSAPTCISKGGGAANGHVVGQ